MDRQEYNAWTRILEDDPLEAMQEQSIPSTVGKYCGNGGPPSETVINAGLHAAQNGYVGPLLALMDAAMWSNLTKELGVRCVYEERGEYRGVILNWYFPYSRQTLLAVGDRRVEPGKGLLVMDDEKKTPLLEIWF